MSCFDDVDVLSIESLVNDLDISRAQCGRFNYAVNPSVQQELAFLSLTNQEARSRLTNSDNILEWHDPASNGVHSFSRYRGTGFQVPKRRAMCGSKYHRIHPARPRRIEDPNPIHKDLDLKGSHSFVRTPL
jgi:hypothetical protein